VVEIEDLLPLLGQPFAEGSEVFGRSRGGRFRFLSLGGHAEALLSGGTAKCRLSPRGTGDDSSFLPQWRGPGTAVRRGPAGRARARGARGQARAPAVPPRGGRDRAPGQSRGGRPPGAAIPGA